MVPGEVYQFSVKLGCSQGQDLARRLELHVTECPVQPHGRVLKDVVGIVPSTDRRKPGKHPAGQHPQAAAAEFDDFVPRRQIARGQPLEAGCQLGGLIGMKIVHDGRPKGAGCRNSRENRSVADFFAPALPGTRFRG